MEKNLESDLPTSTVKEIKRHPVLYIAGTIILLITSITLGVIVYAQNNMLKNEQTITNELNYQLEQSKKEYDALKDNLSKTEEGKKQLETAKAQADADKTKLEGENQQLGKRVSSAEQQANQVKTTLATTQRDLEAKRNDLYKIKSELDAKQTEITKINRCVTLFASGKELFERYDDQSGSATINLINAQNAFSEGNGILGKTYLDQAEELLRNAEFSYDQLQKIFTKVQSGNCEYSRRTS